MWIALGPWQWADDGMGYGWHAPADTIGLLDLRPLPDQELRVIGDHPYGLFVTNNKINDASYYSLGQGRIEEIQPSQLARDLFFHEFGVQPIGTTLLDWIWNLLTVQADPFGLDRPKPIVPELDGVPRLWLGGHSLVHSEKFDLRRGGRYENVIRDLLRHDLDELAEQLGEEVAGRVLAMHVFKYRVPPGFIHSGIKPRKPGTRFFESFPGTTGTLGGDLTWTEAAGAWENVSGQARQTTSGVGAHAYCASTVSSPDHITIVYENYQSSGTFIAPTGRHAATNTFYTHYHYGGNSRLRKVISGTPTDLGSNYSWAATASTSYEMILVLSGSTQRGYIGAITISALTATDTAISSGVNGGLYSYWVTGAYPLADDWELLDNAVIKQWMFWPDIEGWSDQGGSADCTVERDSTYAGLKQTAAGRNKSGTEQGRSTTGETWQTWGVPSGATVDYVRALDVWWQQIAANTISTSGPGTLAIVESSGFTDVTASKLHTISSYGTTTSGSDQYAVSAGRLAVNASYQASNQGIRGEWEYTFNLGNNASATAVPMYRDIGFLIEYTPADTTATVSPKVLTLSKVSPTATVTASLDATVSPDTLTVAVVGPAGQAVTVAVAQPLSIDTTYGLLNEPTAVVYIELAGTVSPDTLALSPVAPTATYESLLSGTVAPDTLLISPVSPTAGFTSLQTATVQPQTLTLTPISPTATTSAGTVGSTTSVALSLSAVPVAASYDSIQYATVTPVSISLAVVSQTATYYAVYSGTVAPDTLTLSTVAPTASVASGTVGTVVPVSMSLAAVTCGANTYVSPVAQTSPKVLALTAVGVTATYESIRTATTAPDFLVLTSVSPTASVSSGTVGSVAPATLSVDAVQPTATGVFSGQVSPQTLALAPVEPTAAYYSSQQGSVAPVVMSFGSTTVAAQVTVLLQADVAPVALSILDVPPAPTFAVSGLASPVPIAYNIVSITAKLQATMSVSPITLTLTVPSFVAETPTSGVMSDVFKSRVFYPQVFCGG